MADVDRIRMLMLKLTHVLVEADATLDEGASAAANLMIDGFMFGRRAQNDAKVCAEIRRVAARLELLASTPLVNLRAVANHNADDPGAVPRH